jgi:hypothetical protein
VWLKDVCHPVDALPFAQRMEIKAEPCRTHSILTIFQFLCPSLIQFEASFTVKNPHERHSLRVLNDHQFA